MDSFLEAGKEAQYGKFRVRILAVVGSGLTILKAGDEDHRQFWVPAHKLAPIPVKPVSISKVLRAAPVIVDTTPSAPIAPNVEEGCDPFINWIRGNSYITVKMPERLHEKFARTYEEKAGRALQHTAGLIITPGGRSYWYSFHIFFRTPPTDISMPSNAHKAKDKRKQFDNVIYSNELGWKLLSLGFQIGNNNVSTLA